MTEYSEPTIEDRVEWAKSAVIAYQCDKGVTNDDFAYDDIVDLMADLGHLCDDLGIDFVELFHTALNHIQAEQEEEQIELVTEILENIE